MVADYKEMWLLIDREVAGDANVLLFVFIVIFGIFGTGKLVFVRDVLNFQTEKKSTIVLKNLLKKRSKYL